MKTEDLVKKLWGIQTIESVMLLLRINKSKAMYRIHRLRKEGYVKTKRLGDGRRVYNIAFENRLKGVSYYEIINKLSPIKVVAPRVYRVYGKEPSYEETLIFAIKTKSLRTILAALILFKKIDNWAELYRLAKSNHIERQVGALYDLSRRIMKTRRMTRKFRNNVLPKRTHSFVHVIEELESRDFKNIENVWRVFLPFNKKDLEAYT